MAAISWVMVSWRATASSSTVESSARRFLPGAPRSRRSPPGPPRRSGAAGRLAASRRRQYVSVDGWNPRTVTASPQAAFQRKSKTTASAASRSDKPVQRLQHQHRGHHLGRDRGPAQPRREQVLEHHLREQLPPVPGQEREHTARSQQMPRHRLDIPQIPLPLRPTLHPTTVSTTDRSPRKARPLFSSLLGDSVGIWCGGFNGVGWVCVYASLVGAKTGQPVDVRFHALSGLTTADLLAQLGTDSGRPTSPPLTSWSSASVGEISTWVTTRTSAVVASLVSATPQCSLISPRNIEQIAAEIAGPCTATTRWCSGRSRRLLSQHQGPPADGEDALRSRDRSGEAELKPLG